MAQVTPASGVLFYRSTTREEYRIDSSGRVTRRWTQVLSDIDPATGQVTQTAAPWVLDDEAS